jgi:DNA-binding protein Fis
MTEETNKQAEELTPEQLAAQRKRVIEYYLTQIEVLKVQAEYEKLLAEIEESRAKRMSMIISQARMSQGPAEEDQDPESEPEAKTPEVSEVPKERKLKKA